MNITTDSAQPRVNWRHVGLFVGLTFVFTCGLDLLLQLTGGYGSKNTALFLQLQMFLPAFFAIFLGLFVFKDSPFYFRNPMPDGKPDRARGFFYLYLILTLFYAGLAAFSTLVPSQQRLASTLSALPMAVGLLGVILFRVFKGREAFARANLRGGRALDWLKYAAIFLVFIALQTGLNALFQLGKPVDADAVAAQLGIKLAGSTLVIVLAFQMILEGSFLGLIIAFGEEYGWRAYLQGQLIRLGKKRGVLIVGLIWGAWHYPVIWMGHNYPGHPVAGTILMTIFCVLLAYVLGHVMLKTGSIWLVAFLHALIDQAANYFAGFIYAPADPIFSFGPGLYGLATVAVVVFFLLRDPIWKDAPAAPALREVATHAAS